MAITEIMQQTLYMNLKDLSPCIEKNEDGEENYVQTNFDEIVSDFCSGITSQGYTIIGKTLSITDEKIFAIIQYINRSQFNKVVTPIEGILKDM